MSTSRPKVTPGIYNAGFENLSILEIAKFIQTTIPCEIEKTESNDPGLACVLTEATRLWV